MSTQSDLCDIVNAAASTAACTSKSKLSSANYGMELPKETIDICESSRKAKTLLTDKVVYVWTLPKFWGSDSANEEFHGRKILSSEPFEAGEQIGMLTEWKIQLQSNYCNGTDPEMYISLHLWLVRQKECDNKNVKPNDLNPDRLKQTFPCIYQFDILNDTGESVFKLHSGIRPFSVGDCFGWPMFIKHAELDKILGHNSSSLGLILIQVQIQLLLLHEENALNSGASTYDVFKRTENVNNNPSFAHVKLSALSKSERNKILGPYRHVKLSIQCRGHTIVINKSLIAEKSPVMYQLIQIADQYSDGNAEILQLDEEYELLNIMFAFLYFKKTEPLESKTFQEKIELLNLGRKYEVEEFINAIFNTLFKCATSQTAVQIALLYSSGNLSSKPSHLKAFRKFLLGNRCAIRETDDYKKGGESIKRILTRIILDYQHPVLQ